MKSTINDATGSKNIESLTGGLNIDAWVDKLTGKVSID
jgi:hypothetical protein